MKSQVRKTPGRRRGVSIGVHEDPYSYRCSPPRTHICTAAVHRPLFNSHPSTRLLPGCRRCGGRTTQPRRRGCAHPPPPPPSIADLQVWRAVTRRWQCTWRVVVAQFAPLVRGPQVGPAPQHSWEARVPFVASAGRSLRSRGGRSAAELPARHGPESSCPAAVTCRPRYRCGLIRPEVGNPAADARLGGGG